MMAPCYDPSPKKSTAEVTAKSADRAARREKMPAEAGEFPGSTWSGSHDACWATESGLIDLPGDLTVQLW